MNATTESPAAPLRIGVSLCELESGTHFDRRIVSRAAPTFHELPAAECQEIRPDWGVYHPVTTHPAIERALRRRGLIGFAGGGRVWTYWVVR